jgi:hypothetical protein
MSDVVGIRASTWHLSTFGLFLCICAVATLVAPVVRAASLYSINYETEELVLVDPASGDVSSIGVVDLPLSNIDLTTLGSGIYLLNTTFNVSTTVSRLDPATGSVIWTVPVTYQGAAVGLAEGLAAADGGLRLSFRSEAAYSQYFSDALGRVDSLGIVMEACSFSGFDYLADADALCTGPDGHHMYWGDNSPSEYYFRLFDVECPPPGMTLLGYLFPDIPITDLAFEDGMLWAIDGNDDQLLRLDPSTGAILETVLLPPATHLDGLAGAPEFSRVPTPSCAARERLQVYPNPAFGEVTVSLGDVGQRMAALQVRDASGRIVRILEPSGCPEMSGAAVRWDGTDVAGRLLPRGVYWIREGRSGAAQKLTLVR